VALGIAALVLFGAFYGIGSATSGGDESEPSSTKAQSVDVPDGSSGAPSLASAGHHVDQHGRDLDGHERNDQRNVHHRQHERHERHDRWRHERRRHQRGQHRRWHDRRRNHDDDGRRWRRRHDDDHDRLTAASSEQRQTGAREWLVNH
jgi:hypothetical protein